MEQVPKYRESAEERKPMHYDSEPCGYQCSAGASLKNTIRTKLSEIRHCEQSEE